FVTLHSVIAQTVTTTHDRLLVAADVICKPEHRTVLHATALDAAREVAVFAANHAIERIARSGNDARYQISWQQNTRICRIIGALVRITCAESIIREFTVCAGWPVKPDGLGRVELARHEVIILLARVELRIDQIEAHPEIDRQPAVDLPVVLQIPLNIGRAILSLEDADIRLPESIEVAEQRVGIRMPGVERVIRVVAEADGG